MKRASSVKHQKLSFGSGRAARWLAAALVAVAVVASFVFVADRAARRSRRQAAIELAELLRSDRPEVRRAAAEQLADLGDAGFPELVEALLDEQETTYSLAASTLDAMLLQWQFLPDEVLAERLSRFAGELHRTVPHMPEERRYLARRWAEQIVACPSVSKSRDSLRLLADCEAILRQCPVLTYPLVRHTVNVPPTAAVAARNRLPLVRRPIEAPPPLPESVATETPNSAADAELASEQPEPAAPPDRLQPLDPAANSQEPQRLVAPAAEPLAARRFVLTEPARSPAAPAPIDEAEAMQERSDLDVMRKLHDRRADLVAAAERELRRRGYRTVDLPLCQALTSPDPAVRRQLAETLPTMHSVQARPWLLQLAEDDDLEVRRAAEGILHTSGDPSMYRRLR